MKTNLLEYCFKGGGGVSKLKRRVNTKMTRPRTAVQYVAAHSSRIRKSRNNLKCFERTVRNSPIKGLRI